METEKRKLIKFSNYSLCVTLSKSVIRQLKWGKGDIVEMAVNEEKGEILIKKGSAETKSKPEKIVTKKPIVSKSIKSKVTKKSRW